MGCQFQISLSYERRSGSKEECSIRNDSVRTNVRDVVNYRDSTTETICT